MANPITMISIPKLAPCGFGEKNDERGYNITEVTEWCETLADLLKSTQGDLLFNGVEQAKVKIQTVRAELERVSRQE